MTTGWPSGFACCAISAFTKPRFRHEVAGYNFRMTSYQAAMGLAQLEKIDMIIDEKRRVASTYNRLLADVPGSAPAGRIELGEERLLDVRPDGGAGVRPRPAMSWLQALRRRASRPAPSSAR